MIEQMIEHVIKFLNTYSEYISVSIILFSWYLSAFENAIRFGKHTTCNEIWHAAKWLSYWLVFGWIMFLSGMSGLYIGIVCGGGFFSNILYRLFRYLDVYKLDDKYRIKWLGKILGRDGII